MAETKATTFKVIERKAMTISIRFWSQKIQHSKRAFRADAQDLPVDQLVALPVDLPADLPLSSFLTPNRELQAVEL